MTEIKKFTKIVLIVDAIVWFIFGVNLLFLYDITMNPEGFTNPYYPRFWGGLCFVATLFAIIMLRKKEWEEIKLTFAFLLTMLISTLIIEVAVLAVLGSSFEVSTILFGVFAMIVEASLLTLGIIAYIKQRS
ncbi:MAG: hypothetical protein ACFFBH_15505 [Promethearchaeota archaeon]